jgi:hypothetical protein
LECLTKAPPKVLLVVRFVAGVDAIVVVESDLVGQSVEDHDLLLLDFPWSHPPDHKPMESHMEVGAAHEQKSVSRLTRIAAIAISDGVVAAAAAVVAVAAAAVVVVAVAADAADAAAAGTYDYLLLVFPPVVFAA